MLVTSALGLGVETGAPLGLPAQLVYKLLSNERPCLKNQGGWYQRNDTKADFRLPWAPTTEADTPCTLVYPQGHAYPRANIHKNEAGFRVLEN